MQSAIIGVDESIFSSLESEYGQLNEILRNLPETEQKNEGAIFNVLEAESGEGLLYLTQGYTGADIERAARVSSL